LMVLALAGLSTITTVIKSLQANIRAQMPGFLREGGGGGRLRGKRL